AEHDERGVDVVEERGLNRIAEEESKAERDPDEKGSQFEFPRGSGCSWVRHGPKLPCRAARYLAGTFEPARYDLQGQRRHKDNEERSPKVDLPAAARDLDCEIDERRRKTPRE